VVSWSEESYLRAVTIGEPSRADGPIHLADYDPAWPVLYEHEAMCIRAALGDRVRILEHAGSTSVPGLAAKPIIDIVLGVADPVDEDRYVSDLETAGYALHIREPDFEEHRMFKGKDPAANLHVFAADSPEIVRMLAFRDRLRTHDDERRLYEATKRELAARHWRFVQEYADAKTQVVEAIIARALADEDPSR
jgi:GrpB-like predicted nucleotidyltransferase (UPF0157 family)